MSECEAGAGAGGPAGAGAAGGSPGVFALVPAGLLAGGLAHAGLDRRAGRRTPRRVAELLLLWLVAGNGAWLGLLGAMHLGPGHDRVAARIGYAPSRFQWEVGWADVAVGLAGALTVWRRDGFLTAAVLVAAVALWGDGLGHVLEYRRARNAAPYNVQTIPFALGLPAVQVALLAAYRRLSATPA